MNKAFYTVNLLLHTGEKRNSPANLMCRTFTDVIEINWHQIIEPMMELNLLYIFFYGIIEFSVFNVLYKKSDNTG